MATDNFYQVGWLILIAIIQVQDWYYCRRTFL